MILQIRLVGRDLRPWLSLFVVVALAVLLVCVSGLQAESTQKAVALGSKSWAVAAADSSKTGTEKPTDQLEFRGRVVDPEGKPVKGAKLYVVYMTPAILPPPKVRAVSDAEGNFRFTMAKSVFDTSQRNESWRSAYLVAVAKGYAVDVAVAGCFDVSGSFPKEGFANRPVSMFPRDATLRLVGDDVAVEGRIVDSEGRPVVGATIRVLYFRAPEKGDLTPWLQSVKSGEDYDVTRPVLGRGKTIVPAQAQQFQYVMPAATTDADGKFRLGGIGRERIARILLEGPGIASEKLYCYTRPGPMFRMAHLLETPQAGTLVYYGAGFEHVARPSMPIVGTLRDRDTGKPLRGINIEARRRDKGVWSARGSSREADMIFAEEYVRAVTDNQGHYRLTGVPDGEGNSILAVPPLDQPYFMYMKEADRGDKKNLARVDFKLKRGVWIRGRVTDRDTGKPLRGRVTYVAMADNPQARSLAGQGWTSRYPGYAGFNRTDKEGRYAIPGLPGRGIIAILVAKGPYRRGAGAEEIQGGQPVRSRGGHSMVTFRTVPGGTINAASYSALAEVNPAEDAEAYERSFTLDPGQRLTCTVLDPAGQPLVGAYFIDTPRNAAALLGPMDLPTFTIEGYYLDQPRAFFFVHKERKLAGSLVMEGSQQGSLSVRLQLWCEITGRVVDENGNSEADLLIPGCAGGPTTPHGYGRFPERHYRTDQQGRFRIEGLTPGIPYEVLVNKKMPSGLWFGEIIIGSTLKPGETRDLGDLTIKEWRRAPTRGS